MAQDLVSIASPGLSADIHPLGAQLFGLRDAQGRDLLWDGDPAVWASRAPILFPIVGELAGGQYRLGEKRFALPRHGFARTSPFALAARSASSAMFRLASDSRTLEVYPFAFELDIAFSITHAALTIAATVKNRGGDIMPASFGYHPALRWPLPYGRPRDGHRILFAQDEAAPVRRLDQHGLVLPQPFSTPVADYELVLGDDLFTNDAIVFDQLASRRVTYGSAEGPQLEVEFEDMPYLGIWTKPGAGFICIEPWHGLADPQGYDGDIRNKPGIILLPPNKSLSCAMTIGLLPDASAP